MATIIIFDLVGVLISVNTFKMMRAIGLWLCIKYYLRHRQNPIQECLKVLDRIRCTYPDQYQDTITFKGFYLPQCICLWQQGTMSGHQATQTLQKYIAQLYQQGYFAYHDDYVLITKMAILFVDRAELGTKAFHLSSQTQHLIKSLNDKHYILYILSNMDALTMKSLEQQHPRFFSLFKDIVISGTSGDLKPHLSIYKKLLDKHHIDPQQAYFIDDQAENIQAALQLGLKALTCSKPGQLPRLLAHAIYPRESIL